MTGYRITITYRDGSKKQIHFLSEEITDCNVDGIEWILSSRGYYKSLSDEHMWVNPLDCSVAVWEYFAEEDKNVRHHHSRKRQ